MRRLILIVSALKQGRHMNAGQLACFMSDNGYRDGGGLVSDRTVRRDIKALNDDFGAGVYYDSFTHGYAITNRAWSFPAPIFAESSIDASAVGGKIAEDITPEPLRSRIRDGVAEILQSGGSDLTDSARLDTLVAASGLKVSIDPNVFASVWRAWRERHSLNVQYLNAKGKIRGFTLDPHVLAYYNSAWYIKGEEPDREWKGVYAVHRIKSAAVTEKTFEPDPELAKDAAGGRVFGFDTVADAEIRCSPSVAAFAREQAKARGQTVTDLPDGSVLLKIPEISKIELVKWILSEGGAAALQNHPEIALEIHALAQKIASAHSPSSARG
jgi:predicted DNA-binding transcriptional regulator YafY